MCVCACVQIRLLGHPKHDNYTVTAANAALT